MQMAYVLISVEPGDEGQVIRELEQVERVSEAHIVYGVWDIVAKVEGSTPKEIKDIVIAQIRNLDHVETTMTLVVAEPSHAENITVPAPSPS